MNKYYDTIRKVLFPSIIINAEGVFFFVTGFTTSQNYRGFILLHVSVMNNQL